MEQPLWSDEEFDKLVREMVVDDAPRVFAVVQVEGEREDAWIVGWGLAFEDGEGRMVYEVVGCGGAKRVRVRSLDRLGLIFGGGGDPLVSVRVEWVTAA
jgi:hypothetical protein